MLDAVRGRGVRANPPDQTAPQPYSVSADVITRHVKLRNQPTDIRLEERRLQGRVREAPEVQATRHLRVQRLARAREEERIGRTARGFHHPLQRAQWSLQSRREAREAAIRGKGVIRHVQVPDHRERGLRGDGRGRREPLVRAGRPHAGTRGRPSPPRCSVVYFSNRTISGKQNAFSI